MNKNNVLLALRLSLHGFKSTIRNAPPAILFFLVLCSLMVSLFLTLVLFMKSSEGLQKGLSFFDSQSAMVQVANEKAVERSNDTTEVNVASASDPEGSETTVVSKSIVKHARDIAEVLSPTETPHSEWINRLSSQRVFRTPLTIKMRPYQVSPLQERIFSMQHIKVVPWDEEERPPAKIEGFGSPVFWVSQSGPKTWVISGSMNDFLEMNKIDSKNITTLDLVRMVMWTDELKAQEEWQKANPAPEPPENIKPSVIGVGIIPHPAALQVSFWIAVGFFALFFAGPCLILAVSSWESSRREGRFEAISGLSVPAWIPLFAFLASRALILSLLLLVASFLSCLAFLYFGFSIPFLSMMHILVLSFSLAFLAQSFGVMAVSWFPVRAWRLWVLVVFTFALIACDVLYIVTFSDSRILALLFSGAWTYLLPIVFIVLSLGCVFLGGKRLSRHGKLGLRNF